MNVDLPVLMEGSWRVGREVEKLVFTCGGS